MNPLSHRLRQAPNTFLEIRDRLVQLFDDADTALIRDQESAHASLVQALYLISQTAAGAEPATGLACRRKAGAACTPWAPWTEA